MTNEQIKEAVSYHIVAMLASAAGVKISIPPYDTGDDFLLIETKKIEINGKKEFYASGAAVSVQLKCTTRESVVETAKDIRYDLKVRNYNQLVRRKQIGTKVGRSPLILILVILNEDKWLSEKETIQIDTDILWFVPKKKDERSNNKYTTRITIPKINKVNQQFFSKLFNQAT